MARPNEPTPQSERLPIDANPMLCFGLLAAAVALESISGTRLMNGQPVR